MKWLPARRAGAEPRSLKPTRPGRPQAQAGCAGLTGGRGSRFGRLYQCHLFYGARALETALAERAFPALRLLEGSPLPAGVRIKRQQTAFAVEISASRGLTLQKQLSPRALAAITDPCSYAASQRCGDAMRERGVQAFEAPSARSLPMPSPEHRLTSRTGAWRSPPRG